MECIESEDLTIPTRARATALPRRCVAMTIATEASSPSTAPPVRLRLPPLSLRAIICSTRTVYSLRLPPHGQSPSKSANRGPGTCHAFAYQIDMAEVCNTSPSLIPKPSRFWRGRSCVNIPAVVEGAWWLFEYRFLIRVLDQQSLSISPHFQASTALATFLSGSCSRPDHVLVESF